MSNFLRIVVVTFALGLTGSTFAHAQAGGGTDAKPSDANPQAYWSTPGDGRLVLLARNAAGFDKPMPLRVRVCFTNVTGENNSVKLLIWTTNGFQSGVVRPTQPQTRQLALGECVEIDQPAALVVQDSTITGTSSGYYQLFEQTALPPEFKAPIPLATESDVAKPIKRWEHDILIGPAKSVPANCHPLPATTPPSPNYLAYCELRLPIAVDPKGLVRGVRVCTGVNYITSDDGKTQYAAGYLELIADKAFVTTPKQSDYDYNFNPITPLGCRDIIGAKNIYFMIGPAASGGYWDATKVRSVNVTLQTITWVAAQ